MNTPFDQVLADPEALRALGVGVRRWMTYTAVVAFALGFGLAWLLFG